VTLSSASDAVLADLVTGATQYRFKFEYNGNITIVDRPARWFRFTDHVPGFVLGATYQVSVSLELNGSFGAYGAPCNITLPFPTTQVQMSQCGVTLSSASDAVFADLVTGASQYRFKFEYNGNITIVDRPARWFRFTDHVPGFVFGATYQVSVAIQSGGNWGSYGAACAITLPAPSSQVQASQCGATLDNQNTAVLATLVTGATNYRYKIQWGNNEVIVTRPESTRWFYFTTHVPGYQMGTTYQISVSVEYGGSYGAYGPVCNVTLPPPPSSAANPNGDNNNTGEEMETEAISGFDAVAFPNPFADAFTLNVRSESHEAVVVRVYDMNGKLLENRNLQASEAATVVIGGNLAAGMYHVTVMQGDNLKTMKMIKTIR
jgi:uncharacterized protein YegP (UPF0339 family)